MIPRCLRRSTLAVLTSACAFACAASGSGAQVPVDPLSVTISGNPLNRIGQPIFVEFIIKNVSNDDLLLKNVSIELDPIVQARFDSAKLNCSLQQRGEIVLLKGATLQQGCRFEMKPFNAGQALWEWSGNLFAADIRYIVVANIEALGDFRYYPTVNVKASEASIFVGGFSGALLLAFFVWVQKLIAEPGARQYWGRNLGYTLLLGIRGAIMAVIALLIGRTTQGAGSPVALTVVDFTGGLLIGIFSYPLASWMADTLKIQGVSSAKKTEEVQAGRPNATSAQTGGETLVP